MLPKAILPPSPSFSLHQPPAALPLITAALFIAIAATLTLLIANPLQAQDLRSPSLVNNWGTGRVLYDTAPKSVASTSFTAGPTRQRLTTIYLRLSQGAPGTAAVSIHLDDAGKPGARQTSMTPSATIPTGTPATIGFTPDTLTHLEPYATYWVSLATTYEANTIALTPHDASSGQPHWQIGDATFNQHGTQLHKDPISMIIRGTADPGDKLAVTNRGQPPTRITLPIRPHAVSFATGDAAFVLNKVRVIAKGDSSTARINLAIHDNGATNEPSSSLESLSHPARNLTTDYRQTDHASGNLYLEPNSTYWVRLAPSESNISIQATASNDEDPQPATGWSIGDNTLRPTDTAWTQAYADTIALGIFADPAQTVTDVTVASSPLEGDTYHAGENLEIEYKFSAPVTHVSGSAAFRIADSSRNAAYVGHSTPDVLLYSYRVSAGDGAAPGGFQITANSIGAPANVNTSADSHPVNTDHAAVNPGDSHQVNAATTSCQVHLCALLTPQTIGSTQTVGYARNSGSAAPTGALTNRVLTAEGASHLINQLTLSDERQLTLGLDRDPTAEFISKVRLNIGNRSFALSDATLQESTLTWSDVDLTWRTDKSTLLTFDEQPATISFERSSYTVTEGSSIDIAVQLSRPLNAAASVAVTAYPGPYTDPTDFTVDPATIQFGTDETAKTISFRAPDDADYDDRDTVDLVLEPPDGGAIITDESSAARIVILDNDTPAIPNTLVSGTPTVSGTPEVGHQLTVSTDDLTDPNGIPPVLFYVWTRIHASDSTATKIPIATSSPNYTLRAADQGSLIKVHITYRDDDGHWESTATATYPAEGDIRAAYVPQLLNSNVSGKTIKLVYDRKLNPSFLAEPGAYAATVAGVPRELAPTNPVSILSRTVTLTLSSPATPSDTVTLSYSQPAANPIQTTTTGLAPAISTTTLDNVTPDNATGAPRLSGARRAGLLVYSSFTNIADPQGVHSPPEPVGSTRLWCSATSQANCRYQWIRVIDTDEIDIPGATTGTYTIADADAGHRIRLRLTFQDAAGNREIVTSPIHPTTKTILPAGHRLRVNNITFSPPPADNLYRDGDVLLITVTLNHPTPVSTQSHIGGTADPDTGDGVRCLHDGATSDIAPYHSGSGTNTLTFRCLIAGGTATKVLALPNSVHLFGTDPNTYNYQHQRYEHATSIHGLAGPEIESITANDPSAGTAWQPEERAELKFTFSEAISVNTARGAPDASAAGTGADGPAFDTFTYDRVENGDTLILHRTISSTDPEQRHFELASDALKLNNAVITGVATGAIADPSHRAHRQETAITAPCTSSEPGQVACALLTVGDAAAVTGFAASDAGSLTPDSFTQNDTTFSITELGFYGQSASFKAESSDETAFDPDELRLTIGNRSYDFHQASTLANVYYWTNPAFTWSSGDQSIIRLTRIPKPTVDEIAAFGVDDTWDASDHDRVYITVRFNEDLDLTGDSLSIKFYLNNTTNDADLRTATFMDQPRPNTLRFYHQLQTTDRDQTAVTVKANSLSLGTARVQSAATEADADLSHGGPRIQGAAMPPSDLPRLTGAFLNAPETHDGSTSFTVDLEFSDEPISGFSYRSLMNHILSTDHGSIRHVHRLEPPSNRAWRITVTPPASSDVTITIPATTSCANASAVCTDDGRKLNAAVTITVTGPEPPA